MARELIVALNDNLPVCVLGPTHSEHTEIRFSFRTTSTNFQFHLQVVIQSSIV